MPNLRGVTAGAVVVGVGYTTWLLGGWGGQSVIRVLDDVGLVGFALFASIRAAWAARMTRGRERAACVSVSVGSAGWAAGEVLWSSYDLVADQTPFPSWVDAGYVSFLVGVALCLGFLLSAYSPGTQLRLLLDGVIVGSALFAAAWVTWLKPVYDARASDPLSLTMSLAYPLADIALITAAVLLLVRVPAEKRLKLGVFSGGLALIAVSDTAFAYLTAAGGYHQHHIIAVGWAWGFLCVGLGAPSSPTPQPDDVRAEAQVPPRATVWLPYLPMLASTVVCTPVLMAGLGPLYVAATLTVCAVMVRHFMVIAENRRLLVDVADRALRDSLTGLANRTLFQDRLAHAMQLHQRDSQVVTVLLMNLDHFRLVNDSLGHPAGDVILGRIAERLVGTVRMSDTVARLGGDEFAILMEGDAHASRLMAQRVVQTFDRPFAINGQDLLVRPSVGLAVAAVGNSDVTADELLMQADVAMNSAKRSRSCQLTTFSPEMGLGGTADAVIATFGSGGAGSGSARLLGELRHAIEHFGLSVVYQPKFDLRTHQVVGLEALVRWPHPRRGLLNPDQFLPLVRQHGLMRSVTAVVLDLALDDAAQWYGKGVGVPVAINVFAPTVSDRDLPNQIAQALEQRGLPPSALTVEITEDLLLDNMGRTRLVFNKLRDNGIRVAIDDFGSGYSALWYLREFPVDEVKLDKDFIAPILTHPASAAIVRAVIDLAHALGVTPVAEGVENAETATRLMKYGCRVAQGFHFSPPLPPHAVLKLLELQRWGVGIRDAELLA